jgi:glycosyltransferase involved in cell wall biosynthesis
MQSERPLFHRAAFGVEPPLPIARLAVADGTTPAIGTTSGEIHRVAALRALADRIERDGPERPALVHAHTGYPDGAAAADLADRLGCPLVITEHATFLARILGEPGQRERYARACARAARIVAVSEVLADQIRSALPEVAGRLVVVPNAVAVDEFRAPALDGRVPDELLFVGYRKEIKGIDTLLAAFAHVVAERPAARLRLIGGSPTDELDARWTAIARRLDIVDRVSFEGVMSRSDIAGAMARASIFVHASRYETFGVVAAEALAAGLPVVATDSGGVTEILGVAPERLGALVPVDDDAAFGAAILETLRRRGSFEPEALRASVRERFGAAFVADRLADLYDDILSEAKHSPASRTVRSIAESPEPLPTTPTVVLGLDRTSTAERLSRLPPALVAELGLITSREPRAVVLPPLRWVAEARLPVVRSPSVAGEPEVAGRTTLALRTRRFLADPLGVSRARAARAAMTDQGIAAAARELERVLARMGVDPAVDATQIEIVPLDGRDVEALRRVPPDPSRRVSVGGLGRLGDRWASRAETLALDPDGEAGGNT